MVSAGQYSYRRGSATGTGATVQIVKADVNRVGLLVSALPVSVVYIWPASQGTATTGLAIAQGGTVYEVLYQKHGDLVFSDWWGVWSVGTTLYWIEILQNGQG